MQMFFPFEVGSVIFLRCGRGKRAVTWESRAGDEDLGELCSREIEIVALMTQH